jgi:hypothetical protein
MHDIVSKLMCFGVDAITIFQSTKIRVIFQLKEKHAPYFIGVHYIAHHTSLSKPFQLYPLFKTLKLCYN